MAFNFNDLGTVQRLLFPLIDTLTSFDPAELIQEKAEDFDDLDRVADALKVVAAQGKAAAEDGIVDGAEIENIKAAVADLAASVQGFGREVIDQQAEGEV
jgi:hypothetical protein